MIAVSLHVILLLVAFIVICISALVDTVGPVRLFPAGVAIGVAALLFT